MVTIFSENKMQEKIMDQYDNTKKIRTLITATAKNSFLLL